MKQRREVRKRKLSESSVCERDSVCVCIYCNICKYVIYYYIYCTYVYIITYIALFNLISTQNDQISWRDNWRTFHLSISVSVNNGWIWCGHVFRRLALSYICEQLWACNCSIRYPEVVKTQNSVWSMILLKSGVLSIQHMKDRLKNPLEMLAHYTFWAETLRALGGVTVPWALEMPKGVLGSSVVLHTFGEQ